MAKCRMLLQENEELGKVITSGRTAKLEGEIAVQKQLVQEMKGNQSGNRLTNCFAVNSSSEYQGWDTAINDIGTQNWYGHWNML